MAVTGMQFGWLWARDFDDPHSHSVTVQVHGFDSVMDCSLFSTWTAGESHHASDAFITQCVSANGVENFPTQNTTSGNLVPVLFRQDVTSVTFKISVYQTKGMARWMIYHWA
ncbi:hypothetical protein DEA8626_01885 [Defluviimonas aquaemixtae]|uniref:Uncharacterized protein n=1 Tax=Albidovulum aquaemixtae TaxID=1542388 RepID=A0A2R8B6T2_9RHOB|nr:hypothetical protein [Defluviimonas aquaemixtae]SPH18348.1 hypothetical protein DEA8626_01885 [Defluviimonas aquaemixtae]